MTHNITDVIVIFYEIFWSFINYALPMTYRMLVAAVIFTFSCLIMLLYVSTLCVLTVIILHPNQRMKHIKLMFREVLEEVVDEVVGKEVTE